VAEEVDQFRSRIANARSIFMVCFHIIDGGSGAVELTCMRQDLTVINLAHGQDVIIQNVRDLIVTIQQTQKEQLVGEASECHMCPSIKAASQSRILGEMKAQKNKMEAQKQEEARHQFLSQVLSKRVVANTAYDDQGKRPCDSDTRIDVLADIRQWASDISEHACSFLWLTGKPGCGKSAVTASVA